MVLLDHALLECQFVEILRKKLLLNSLTLDDCFESRTTLHFYTFFQVFWVAGRDKVVASAVTSGISQEFAVSGCSCMKNLPALVWIRYTSMQNLTWSFACLISFLTTSGSLLPLFMFCI